MGMVLRDVLFMVIIFVGISTMGVLYYESVGTSYNNPNVTTNLEATGLPGLNDRLIANLDNDTYKMTNATGSPIGQEGLLGSFGYLATGFLAGATTILAVVFYAPNYIGSAFSIILTAINVPNTIALFVGKIINIGIYTFIIFVLISAALRGGKT